MGPLIFVRHGQTTWNLEGRLQGRQAHPDLTPLGVQQARAAADRLAQWGLAGPIMLWSSDLRRARHTAQLIGEVLRLPVRESRDLAEQGLGEMEGRLPGQLVTYDQPAGLDISEVRWGGGESVQDVHERVGAFLAGLDDGTHILVSHGDTIRIALAALAGRSHRDVEWVPIENGSLTVRERTSAG